MNFMGCSLYKNSLIFVNVLVMEILGPVVLYTNPDLVFTFIG
jgi:hypothetical protein